MVLDFRGSLLDYSNNAVTEWNVNEMLSLPPNHIKAELVRRGLTPGSVGESLGVSREYVSMTIHGKRTAARVRRAIASAIEMPYADVWGVADPDHSEPDGHQEEIA